MSIFLKGVSSTRAEHERRRQDLVLFALGSTLSSIMADVQHVYMCVHASQTPKLTPGFYSLASLHLSSSYLKSNEIGISLCIDDNVKSNDNWGKVFSDFALGIFCSVKAFSAYYLRPDSSLFLYEFRLQHPLTF